MTMNTNAANSSTLFPLANEGHTNWITVVLLVAHNANTIVSECAHITMTQYRILLRLSSGAPLTVTDLAHGLKFSVSTITTAINELEKKQCVKRSYSEDDGRIVYVAITDNGTKTVETIDPEISALVHDLWSLYSDDELEMTYQDSEDTVETHNVPYIKNGEISVENAYIESAFVLLSTLTRHMNQAHISLNEYRVLYLLYATEHPLRICDLSRNLLLRSNETTIAVSKLAKHGFVEKRRAEHDRRSSVISITEEGKQKIKTVTPEIIKSFQNDICALSDNAFAYYDSIAHKILSKNRIDHLLL